MQRLQKAVYWAIIASETSHVFCCVLPTLFSVLSLLAGVGMITAIPGSVIGLHSMMHEWEMPLILLSGSVVLFGWALHGYSRKIDCHNTGCHHGACAPRKRTAGKILKIATVLFFANLAVYLIFHQGLQTLVVESAAPAHSHDGDHH